MSSSLTFASIAAQVYMVSTSTTSISGIISLGGVGGGGGASSPPSPPPPTNPILNTILQNMGQLQLQLTNLTSAYSQLSMSAYYRKSPLYITIMNTILPPTAETIKFDRFNGDGDPNVHIDSFMTRFLHDQV